MVETAGYNLQQSKNDKNNQESIQSCTTPDAGYRMGKRQKLNLTSQTSAKRSAVSQLVTTWQEWTDT